MIGCLVSTYKRENLEMKKRSVCVVLATVWSISVGAAEVANVNGKALTSDDVKRALTGATQEQRSVLLKDNVSKKRFVNDLIDQEILIQQAQKEKLDQSPEFQAAVEAFKRQYLANQLFTKKLGPQATDDAAKKYYRNHLSHFSTDSVQVQHILLSDETTAKSILAEVSKPGVDFQVIAEKQSKDPSAKYNRGDVGWITHTSPLAREFKDAAFSAEKGKVVGPIQTSFGYHLIRVVDRRVGKSLDYDEVELQVKSAMREELTRSFMMQLEKSAQVKVFDQAIQAL